MCATEQSNVVGKRQMIFAEAGAEAAAASPSLVFVVSMQTEHRATSCVCVCGVRVCANA